MKNRKGMKATVVLFFFLGMNSLLFCINPKDQGIYEDAYMVTNAILKGSQVCRIKRKKGRNLNLRLLREASSASSTASSLTT